MTERFKVLVLKTSVGQLTASSNLALSATKKDDCKVIFFRVSRSYGVGVRLQSRHSPFICKSADHEADNSIREQRNDDTDYCVE